MSTKVENYQKILSILKSELIKPIKIQVWLLISHDFDFVQNREKIKDFLTALESEFGKPSFYQDEGAYISLVYSL